VRTNITEDSQDGVPLTLTITLVNTDNGCLPLSGFRVDIWHCNKRGYYSAYNGQPGIDGTVNNAGTTWLRGIQYTDANGQVTFETIYPGWYNPRATHIHVQIFDSQNNLLVTSQIAMPDSINTTVNAFYNTSGTNPFTNTNDMVFSDSYEEELATVTGDTTNGYVAVKEIAFSAGTSAVEHIEAETGGQFGRLMNYPNPCKDSTTISFVLVQRSDFTLTVADESGRLIEVMQRKNVSKGKVEVAVNTSALSPGQYIYRIEVTNISGVFGQSKRLIKQ
jgi:protocatechuate 3,4-dioxygenase beta subunit